MPDERKLTNVSCAAAALFAALCGTAACQRAADSRPANAHAPPKITLFYSPTPTVSRGDLAKLCYSTEAVAALRLEPAVAEVYPAYSRCVEFAPAGSSEYKLIGTGKGGEVATAQARVDVAGPRPKFTNLRINATSVAAGEVVHFCFQAQNAVSVTGSPGEFTRSGTPAGDCLIDHPRATTTYRLTIRNASGVSESEQITVQVKGSK